VENPRGPSTGTDRVIRDGSWYVGPVTLRCSARFGSVPTGFSADVGLRCVRGR
jgi:formylglycine-generating enzyme required for sulfatase activity